MTKMMKKGQYRARKKSTNKFTVEDYDKCNLSINYENMISTNQIIRKTNTDMQSLLREMNISCSENILNGLIITGIIDNANDVQLENIDYMKKLTKSYLIILQKYFEKNNIIAMTAIKNVFEFDENNDVDIEESEIIEYIDFLKENSLTHNGFLKKINTLLIDLEYLMLYFYNISQKHQEIDFSDILDEYKNLLDVFVEFFEINDFNFDKSFYGFFYNIFSIHKYFIDDFEVYIMKNKLAITKDNFIKVLKDFKTIASKSKKIEKRKEIQQKYNIDLYHYYRCAAFLVLDLEFIDNK